MNGMLRRLARVALVATTLLALALTVILAVVTSGDGRVSIAVGLLGTVLAMLISLSAELHARFDDLEKKHEAVALLAALLKTPQVAPQITAIIDSAARAQERSKLMSYLMAEALTQASERIKEVGDGCFQCERGRELRFVKRVLQETTTVRAIANRGLEWYDTPASKAYFDAYGERAKEPGVQIIRVFVVKTGDWDRMDAILASEKARHVETHCVREDDVPPDCRRAIVIFDDLLLHRTVPKREGYEQRAVEFVDEQDEILEAISSFEIALRAAQDKGR